MAKKNRDVEKKENKKEDVLEFRGIVEEAYPSALFRVKCENGPEVTCTISGKLRYNRIRILPGDTVTVEMSPYDTTKGRISWRFKLCGSGRNQVPSSRSSSSCA